MVHKIYTQGTRFTLPSSLTEIRVDFRVAEQLRLFIKRVHRAAGKVETAFLLSGEPPTLDRPGRISDVEPLDSTSSAVGVEIEPEAALKAQESLARRGAERGRCVLGIAHSHPGRSKPQRSGTDARWHVDCLDMNWRQDLVVSVAGYRRHRDGNDYPPLRLQVFYSLIFPSTGSFENATAYLLVRPEGCDALADREFEIRHVYRESAEARRQVAKLLPAIGRASWHRVTITYAGCENQEKEVLALPAGLSASDGGR